MKFLYPLAITLLCAPALVAEEEKDDKDERYFDRVTVTATGQPINTLDTPASVSVIDREEIERRDGRGAIDLIRTLPGVQVNGVGLNQPRPIVRGQRGLRVLMLQNGMRLNNPRRQTDFGEIAGVTGLERLEAIEVLRGPASVLYGSDAIGGVVNLVTARPSYERGTLGGELGASFDSAGDSFGSHAEIGGRLGDVTFQIGAHYRDGSSYEAPAGSFGAIRLDGSETVLDSGIQDDQAYGRATLELDPHQRVSLEFGRYRAEETGFGLVEPAAIGDDSGTRIRILYPYQEFDRWALGWQHDAADRRLFDNFEIKAYTQSNERELVNDIAINFGSFGPGLPDSGLRFDTTNFTDVDTLGLRAEARKLIGAHLLTYGLDGHEDRSVNTDLSVSTQTLYVPGPPFPIVERTVDTIANTPNATNRAYALFLQDRVRATERLDLIVGARYQEVETNADATPGLDTTGLDFDDSALVGAASAVYRVSERWRLGANVGSAFRAPNIVERLFNGPTPEGSGYQIVNPELESERSENVEFGVKYRDRGAYVDATIFRNDVKDGVIQDFLSPAEFSMLPGELQDEITGLGLEDVVVRQVNADELRYEGLELAGGYRFESGWTLDANLTHLDVERVDSAIPVQDTAQDRFNLSVLYRPHDGRFWGEYRLLYNDGQAALVDPAAPTPLGGELPDYTVHTLAGGVEFSRSGLTHRIGVTLSNLTDELYAEFSNALFFRPQPERSARIDYRVRF